MADRKIDYDEGVLIRVHPGTGMDVFMYVNQPGKYLTAHATPVPDNIAAEAGYEVERLAKDRLRMERKAKAGELIDAELANEASTKEECAAELNGFHLVTIGMGRYNVKDPDNNVLNRMPLPKEQAERLFNAMAGEKPKGAVPPGKNKE